MPKKWHLLKSTYLARATLYKRIVMCCAVLCCAVLLRLRCCVTFWLLCCVVLCCVALCCVVFCYVVSYCVVLFSGLLCCVLLCYIVCVSQMFRKYNNLDLLIAGSILTLRKQRFFLFFLASSIKQKRNDTARVFKLIDT